MKINKLTAALFSVLPIQRKAMLKQMKRNNPHLLASKNFQKDYNQLASVVGTNARLEMHRRSCEDAYVAKRLKVEAKQGNHRFIHPATNA